MTPRTERTAAPTLTITGVVMGSPAYISPEQATGEKNLDTRSDIYALGASLYHMLAGEVPYDGDSPLQVMLKHMNDPLPDARKREPSVSEGTRRLIFKMMAKRPEGRFQTPRELVEAVAQIERHLAGGPPPAFMTTGSQTGVKAAAAATAANAARKAAAKANIPPSTEDARPPAPKPEKTEKTATVSDKKKELGERLRKIVGNKRRRP